MKKSVLIICFLAAVLGISFAQCQPAQDRYVIVLSMDGFRWDYPTKAHTPTLDSLREAGVSAITRPPFPANTFPCHYAMATGLNPDKHGIVDNSFYDKKLGREFAMSKKETVRNPVFWKGEPIWNTAERQGVKSATFYWVGSETPIGGRQPSIWKAYGGGYKFYQRADSVIKWISLPESSRPHLIMWYVSEPDATGHKFGPESPEMIKKVESLDRMLAYFFRRIRQAEVFDKIDFIVTSDHGMTSLSSKRYINLYNKLDRNRIASVRGHSPLHITVNDPSTDIDVICKQLRGIDHIKAWKREKIPAKYRYGTDADREGDIIALPETGYSFVYRPKDKAPKAGSHGADPYDPQMQTIFFAAGPSFKQNYRHKSFASLNLHLLIATLLGIEPAPGDGNIKDIRGMLVKERLPGKPQADK